MRSSVRKIGNSRGVLIPASFLFACQIESEIELRLDRNQIVIEPVHAPRTGWFDGYMVENDEDAWSGWVETEVQDEGWQWYNAPMSIGFGTIQRGAPRSARPAPRW